MNYYLDQKEIDELTIDGKDLQISFDFMALPRGRGEQYIFQTHDTDQGVRLEIPSRSVVNLISGNRNSKKTVMNIRNNLSYKYWLHVNMTISTQDGIIGVLGNEKFRCLECRNNVLEKISFGNGNIKGHSFKGKIKNIKVLIQDPKKDLFFQIGIISFFAFLISFLVPSEKMIEKLQNGRFSKIFKSNSNTFFVYFIFGILSILMLVALGYHAFFSYRGFPYSTFLFDPLDRFNDLFNTMRSAIAFNPYRGSKLGLAPYFPFAYLISGLYAKIFSPLWVPIMFLSLISAMILLFKNSLANGAKEQRKPLYYIALLFIIFINYPVLFTLDRANIELFIFCGFVVSYLNFKKHPWVADITIAGVIAAKLYPALFMIFYLKNRQYKRIVVIAFLAIFLELFSLWVFQGSIIDNFTAQLAQQKQFTEGYGAGAKGWYYRHSLWSGLKSINAMLDLNLHFPSMMFGYALFTLVTVFGFLIVALRYPFEDWQLILIIISLMSLLPFASADYLLLHFLLPLALFLEQVKEPNPFKVYYAFYFALILAPLNYSLSWITPGMPNRVHLSTIATPLTLLLFLYALIYEGKKRLKTQAIKGLESSLD
ncbi:MAG: glycosyltransferase family 87 protein [SAR324 cluster bacterium]|nr:glycosyltransferase family 87 protein [SAR324 cluster bacterium]